MPAFAAAGATFLMAVLWFDLMFDVQVRRHGDDTLPPEVLDSISAYYRRVTTDASPMGRLIMVVMLATLAAITVEIVRRSAMPWLAWTSLALAFGAVGVAAARTVRNAVALGRRDGPPELQSRLARSVYRDHFSCFMAMTVVAALQLSAGLR